MMFNFTVVRNGRRDDCWMQWKLPSRSSPLAVSMSHWYPPTNSSDPKRPSRMREEMERVWALSVSEFFFLGWGFVRFFFFAMQEMVLSGMSHLGDAVEADGHSISGIHRTHYMDPWPWVFYFFCFSVYFSVGWFFMAFWCCCFSHVFAIEHIHWTFRRSSPGTLGRDSLPASAFCEEALSIRVSGGEKCVKSDFAFPNKGLNRIVTWTVDVESRTRYLVESIIEKCWWRKCCEHQFIEYKSPCMNYLGCFIPITSAWP